MASEEEPDGPKNNIERGTPYLQASMTPMRGIYTYYTENVLYGPYQTVLIPTKNLPNIRSHLTAGTTQPFKANWHNFVPVRLSPPTQTVGQQRT